MEQFLAIGADIGTGARIGARTGARLGDPVGVVGDLGVSPTKRTSIPDTIGFFRSGIKFANAMDKSPSVTVT